MSFTGIEYNGCLECSEIHASPRIIQGLSLLFNYFNILTEDQPILSGNSLTTNYISIGKQYDGLVILKAVPSKSKLYICKYLLINIVSSYLDFSSILVNAK